ncbi:unnamed protein product [Alopecurus aequalis]
MVWESVPLHRKKVCVIGAGMAGLAAARELRREGHDVTVLEQSGDVGGQWQYDPRRDVADPLGTEAPVKVHSSMYASLRLISARENMGFTDFPFVPKDGRDQRRFPGHREVYLYLKDFCDVFGLMESVVVVVGSGESGKDIAMEVRKVAKEVHLDRLCDEGRVVFCDGSRVAADTIIYLDYSFPFLDTAGAVTVDDNRVGPLFEHVFPPSLAPSLSFIGIPKKVFAPWFFEAQAKWVAQVLSGRRTLPSEEEMMRSMEECYRACEIAGVPRKYTHDIGILFETYMDKFVDKCCDFPRLEKWNYELLVSSLINMHENLETFRDEYQDTDSIRKGLEAWRLAAQQVDQAAAVGAQIQSLGLREEAE